MQPRQGPAACTVLLRLVQAAFLLGLTPQAASSQTPPRQVITHEGPLVLRGTQVYTIENATFIQHGPIEVYDQAQLIIRDSTVEFRVGYHEEFQWHFQGSSQLIVERAKVNAAYTCTVWLQNNARARVVSSELSWADIEVPDRTTVLLSNSTINSVLIMHFGSAASQYPTFHASRSTFSFGVWLRGGQATGTVRGLAPGKSVSWRLSPLEGAPMAVELSESFILGIAWRVGGNARINFEQCDIGQLGPQEKGVVWVRNGRVGPELCTRAEVGRHG